MKLITLSFIFLFAFPILTFSSSEPLLDTDGNPILTGTAYYIKPILLGPPFPPAVTLGYTGKSTCPTTVEINHIYTLLRRPLC
ncbi:hypothetical protein Ahy_A05g023776 [Arachis hypogaea]|uniref:Uncharacterized protein n=1 Tax=Arachis hypogaea TaxID=3818 RepID=A0A445D4Z3_ARAHY|nr:hypothetical protein Ahy_A05g023776 [Arachis hypogaea]